MNDEQLILYYYDDGLSASERVEIASALERDEILAARFEHLKAMLDAPLDSVATTPQHLSARWHASITAAAERERRSARPHNKFHPGSFFWGSAITAALVVGIGLGVLLGKPDDVALTGPSQEFADAASNPNAFDRGARLYLADSRQTIDRLDIGDAADRIVLVSRVIEQNRMLRRHAEESNQLELARSLRAMEILMVELATRDMQVEDAAQIQAQLLFEMNIVLTRLQQKASERKEPDAYQETTT